MISVGSKLSYRAFGLALSSELALPELFPCSVKGEPDLEIRREELTGLWERHARPKRSFAYFDDTVMFIVPDTAIFCVSNSQSILYSPMPNADLDKLRLYILGTCMGIALLQKRILALHGSAIAINGRAYACIGDSGAGKSTLASVLIRKGYALLSDDVVAVTLTSDGTPMVSPSYPQQKLWKESIEKLGLEQGAYKPLFERETKFAVPAVLSFCNDAMPLAGVVELVKNGSAPLTLREVKGLERFQLLFRNTYRHFIVERCGLLEWHFGMLASIVNRIAIKQLQRPEGEFTADLMADMILDEVHEDKEDR